jgi:hypothetical protein
MTFNVTAVEATQTLIYSPDSYLEYCAEYDTEPTEPGFLAFIEADVNDDFGGFEGELVIHRQPA